MKETAEKLVNYWKSNIQENIKTVSAIIFLILTKVFAIIAFGIKLELDLVTILIILYFALDAYIVIWMRVIFTGEVSATKIERDIIQQQIVYDKDNHINELAYEREISEYKIILAAAKGEVPGAIISNANWNTLNERITKMEKLNRTPAENVAKAIEVLNENLPKVNEDDLPINK